MKLVMVTTAHAHWDGLAGNTAMFSEAVVPATLVEALPKEAIDTVFIKKNPQTRRFETAWLGRTKNFKRVNRQDKDYITFEVEGLKKYNCPEVLRTKTVGCHILNESVEPLQEAPRRPMSVNRERPKREVLTNTSESKEGSTKETSLIQEIEEIAMHLNGRSSYPEKETAQYAAATETIVAKKEVAVNTLTLTEPGFFTLLTEAKDPSEFERYCFYLLRLIGIHEIHRPLNFAGADAHGFFKFGSLSVVYATTLVPAVLQDNPLIIEHYLNLLRKEKMRLANTSYTIKDTQKQVWLLCNAGHEVQHLRTDDGIKLKVVPVSILINLYRARLNDSDMNTDNLWDNMKNL